MSEFSHSLHIFNQKEDEIVKALTASKQPAAIVAIGERTTTVVGGWGLAEILSTSLQSVLELSFAEDHGFQLFLSRNGQLVACFNSPFGEQVDDLGLEEFETDADRARRERTVAAGPFVDHLIGAGVTPPADSGAVLAALFELERLAAPSGQSDPELHQWTDPAPLVQKLATVLGLPAYSWLSEDYVFRDYEHSPEEVLERFPALRLFGRAVS